MNPYESLTPDQQIVLLDSMTEQVDRATDFLGALRASRAILMNLMQENHTYSRIDTLRE